MLKNAAHFIGVSVAHLMCHDWPYGIVWAFILYCLVADAARGLWFYWVVCNGK